MTDKEFRRTVAEELASVREALQHMTEFLQVLSRQQGELNAILEDLCDRIEPDDDEDDPFGLFENGPEES